ncbi:MAG: acyl-CoA thioesterase [Rhodospirillaceae bacterium]|jgi:acyl-CoA thioesterase YciA|nr:acyl-CoA thioesterase [Rhodospirillaceae bacterium]MBT6406915.1 acyl-CoA thioesterase [Rhodospirillaceae bacterium]
MSEKESTDLEEPRGELALRTLAMPGDTNPAGDIFGGWLMGQMDIAGGILAGMRAQGRVATIAVDGFVFHNPVHVGDVLCCYGDVLEIGRTSIKLRIQAWVLRGRQAGDRVKVTEGIFTFVAIDENRQKRPVPPEID